MKQITKKTEADLTSYQIDGIDLAVCDEEGFTKRHIARRVIINILREDGADHISVAVWGHREIDTEDAKDETLWRRLNSFITMADRYDVAFCASLGMNMPTYLVDILQTRAENYARLRF